MLALVSGSFIPRERLAHVASDLEYPTGPDGVLNLSVPLGEANTNVVVEIRVSAVGSPHLEAEVGMTFEQSLGALADDPSFRRHEQLPLEERRPLD